MSVVWLAPAKLNLFLHVTGRREDGYHLLQTVFQFIDLYDELEFTTRPDGRIHRIGGLDGIAEVEDLAVIAARRLQQAAGCDKGVDISIIKTIPAGAGLGGGSSDAATTLIALNQLWKLGLDRGELARIGLEIGADVPVFVRGENAWAEGVGEELRPIELESYHFVIVIPPIHVPTGEVFANLKLTCEPKPIKIRDFLEGNSANHLQETTCRLYPQVARVIDWLAQYGQPRMTGTGSAVFLKARSRQQAQELAGLCPSPWRAVYVRGLSKHPHG